MLLAAFLSFCYKDGATLNLFLAGISVLLFGVLAMLCTNVRGIWWLLLVGL